MPRRVWMPNFPLTLRLYAPPRANPPVQMPEPGIEGTFKTNEIILRTVNKMTKPEIRHFLTAVYGLNVKYVNSLNMMGNRRNKNTQMPRRTGDYKKFYVKLHDEVELPNVPKGLQVLTEEMKNS